MKKLIPAVLGTLAAVAIGGAAQAQAAAPAPAPALPNYGPALPGVCVFSREQAAASSAVGQSYARRMEDLKRAVDAELQADYTALQAEGGPLQAQLQQIQQSGAQPDQALQLRAKAFQDHVEAFQEKRNVRTAELQQTEAKQLDRIYLQMTPVVVSVMSERSCSVVINGNNVYGANPAMDLGPLVVSRLNAKVTQVNFEREHIDPRAGQGVAAAPRPAAPAAAAAKKPAVKK